MIKEVFSVTDKGMKEFEFEGCTATAVLLWRAGNNHRYVQTGFFTLIFLFSYFNCRPAVPFSR